MRNLKRIIYTSSYDRGLEHLLRMWPAIKKAVPKAELHIFYGWQLFELFVKDNPGSMRWMENMKEMMTQDGITDHGRVPQKELEKEIKRSGIWAYPTHFGEINCISALKAQAWGCEPVVVNYAALRETVKYGRRIEGDIYDEETKREFQEQLIKALQNPMEDKEREQMVKEFSKVTWDNIINSWIKDYEM